MAEIRPFRPDDAAGAAEVLTAVLPEPTVISPTGALHWATSSPDRARLEVWVAVEDGAVVAWADAQLRWSVTEDGVTEVWIAVHPDRRRCGLGRALDRLTDAHVRSIGASRITTFARADEPESLAFAERRGYRETRRDQSWHFDLRALAPTAPAVREGFRVARLGELRDRERELFEIYDQVHTDMPSDYPMSLDFEEWRRETWENPRLDFETSAVVLEGDRPVAIAWITSDRETRRGEHELTGTARDSRGRGLARLAKEAALHWAADSGLEYVVTSNDDTNSPMLALNRKLGYQPGVMYVELAKDV